MQEYQYKHGDRPLDGYTIQRAAGRGGFGEVYYAVSDSGREVALKVIQNYEHIEVRGISQCMNLKSPHLVTIFDVKYNEKKKPFVIMEYVSGPSLRELLNESPGGMGPQKAAFFLREIAKGLSFLHESGIVHRDLKPSNIFYENGYVKIGDYGLTKAISASRHSAQTITVGTVHYMAPEIGAGNYDRGVDIYTLGVMLYEMLTGRVPFAGSSPAEILMKHMTAVPELDGMEKPFGRVVRKALAKDPTDRYQSVQEMVEDVFGVEHVRDSVSGFCPEELSVVAERIAKKAHTANQDDVGAKDAVKETGEAIGNVGMQIADAAKRFAEGADAIGKKVASKVDAHTDGLLGGKGTGIKILDGVDDVQRKTLAFVTMILVALGAGALDMGADIGFLGTALAVFVMTGICEATIVFWRARVSSNLEAQSQWVGKVAACCVASLVAAFLGALCIELVDKGTPEGLGSIVNRLHYIDLRRMLGLHRVRKGVSIPGAMWLSLAVAMILVDWMRISSPRRAKRLSLGSAVWAGMLGLVAAWVFNAVGLLIGAVLAGTSLTVQAASPFGKVVRAPARSGKAGHRRKKASGGRASSTVVRPLVRTLWLLGFLGAAGLGFFLLIWAGVGLRGEEFAFGIAFGVDALGMAVFCLVMAGRRRFGGMYEYLVKPILVLVFLEAVVTSAILLGLVNNSADQVFIMAACALAAGVAFVVGSCLRRRYGRPGAACEAVAASTGAAHRAVGAGQSERASSFNRLLALVLSGGGLFGFCGLHRFYVGKIGTGILWFLTFGLFGVGQVIDVIMISLGWFKDRYGWRVTVWHEAPKANVAAAAGPTVEPAAAAEYEQPERADLPEPEVQAAAAPSAMTTTTILYEPFHPLSFLLSGLGTALTLGAIGLGLILGFRFPYLVAAGWPDAGVAASLDKLFGYSEWPELVTDLGRIGIIVLILLAMTCVAAGRRHRGAAHLLRAVAGLIGILVAVLLFGGAARWQSFEEVARMLNSQRIGPAFETALGAFHAGKTIFAGVFFALSVVALSWPAKRKESAYIALPNQGAE